MPSERTFDPHARFAHEATIGGIIREACEMDDPHKMFRLTCSVGELAQRIAAALSSEARDAD